MDQQNIKIITPDRLLSETLRLKNKGYRLAAISCAKNEGMEISYSFDKDYNFLNLRLIIEGDAEVESITSIYPFSFLYENEIKELFGVKIINITPDFNDNLYKISVKTPFNNKKEGE